MLQNIRFVRNAPLAPEALRDLFAQTDWARQRMLSGIVHMLQQTPLHMSAWHDKRLVAFARVLTDGVYRAIIEDVIVAHPYRGCGLGKKMIALLLAELAEVEEVLLGCKDDLIPFYAQFGFKRDKLPFMKRRKSSK